MYPTVSDILKLISPFKTKPSQAAYVGELIHYHAFKNFKKSIRRPSIQYISPNFKYIFANKIRRACSLLSELPIKDVEVSFINTELKYRGRVDALTKNNEIVELKTGKFYDFYEIQGAAYAKAFNSNRVIFVVLGEEEPLRILEGVNLSKKIEEWIKLLNEFYGVRD